MPSIHSTVLLLAVMSCLLLLATTSLALPDSASLEPSLLFPSAGTSSAQPVAASTIPALPEQSKVAAVSSICQLTPSPPLLPATLASCNVASGGGDGTLPPRLQCCPARLWWRRWGEQVPWRELETELAVVSQS